MTSSRSVVAGLALFGCAACGEATAPIPDFEPFSALSRTLAFGVPARVVADRSDVELNDDGQYVTTSTATDRLYLFDTRADGVPPHPTDPLVELQIRTEVQDSVDLWRRWHDTVRRASEALGTAPRCAEVGGAQFRITRAEFPGEPSVSVGAQIDVAEDGGTYEAHLIVAARRSWSASDFERELGRTAVECRAPPEAAAGA